MSAWQTVRGGDDLLERSDWKAIAASTVFITPIFAYGLGTILETLLPKASQTGTLSGILGLLYIQVAAPVFTIVLIGPSLLILRYALRIGWAGLNVALLFPAVLLFIVLMPSLRIDFSSDMVASFGGAMCGLLHGRVMWVTLYLRKPQAVAPRTPAI